jgi:hypothetical protein
MIGQTGGQCRSTLNPTMAETANRQLEAQAMMRMTEIVQTANDIHASFQGLNFASQGTSSPGKAIETLTKGGVEALDEGGIDLPSALCFLDDGLDHRFTALHNAPRNVQLPIDTLFDNLHNGDVRPGNQLRASQFSLAARQSCPKSFAEGRDVACQTIQPSNES